MKRTILLTALLAAGILILAGCAQSGTNTGASVAGKSSGTAITIFKSDSCGCCGVYTKYMDREGYNVTINTVRDTTAIKEQYGVPAALQSCHTTVVGDYVVEGHIPSEAVEKLLSERPDIKGIALPGMPSGSPGMPGSKTGEWTIYALNNDGSYDVFMKV
ncbi:TPA: DUF411 domain-containing protein [Candidatus Woesearchaeota archaeon]|nr:DUF411 domain-containing protein [Candidatus Woesearchaeota archaeon]HII68974.1 DUF411 domain-containing protein [Candidatus Woesearchaeota archaeon]